MIFFFFFLYTHKFTEVMGAIPQCFHIQQQ